MKKIRSAKLKEALSKGMYLWLVVDFKLKFMAEFQNEKSPNFIFVC